MATGHFSGKWMASAAPPCHADSEYVIGFALKYPLFECIEGHTDRQTDTHICSLLYRYYQKCLKVWEVII